MVGRASSLNFTDVISHWPRAEGIYAGSEQVLTDIAGRLAGGKAERLASGKAERPTGGRTERLASGRIAE